MDFFNFFNFFVIIWGKKRRKKKMDIVPTIRAGNDNMKVPTILTQVFRRFCGNAGAPKSALDVGEAGWIGAIGGRLHDWVSLIIDIESCASIDSSVTTLRTFLSVVTFKSVEA